MMMNKKKALIIFPILLMVGIAVYFVFAGSKEENYKDRVVFIENNKVFEGFQMKKDYDRLLEKDLMVESQRLDSLGNLVNGMSQDPKVSSTALEMEKEKYFATKKIFEERFSTISKEYTAQVYERLNNYIQEYGKMKGFRMVLGANGQGNVMYVDKSADITSDIIVFCNKKYLDK